MKRNESLGWQIAVLAKNMAQDLDEALKAHDLKIGYWPTLFLLWEEEGLSQTELAKGCMTEHYTTTRTLDKLEILGLVERRPDPQSRRTFRIFLTDKGRRLQKPLTAEAEKINEKYLAPLSETKKESIIKMLQQINRTDD